MRNPSPKIKTSQPIHRRTSKTPKNQSSNRKKSEPKPQENRYRSRYQKPQQQDPRLHTAAADCKMVLQKPNIRKTETTADSRSHKNGSVGENSKNT